MFTGLVQAIGRLEACPGGVRVTLAGPREAEPFGPPRLGGLHLGDSVAVDGVCLTVAELLGESGSGGFRADASSETLRRSTLQQRAGERALVNLEPALRLSDRLGGHLVSGHVDGVGRLVGVERDAVGWWLEIAWLEPAFGRYICEKASVAVDGISLTVADCEPAGDRFRIAVIPHTWQATTLRQRRAGDLVNLEADLLAKYTERLLTSLPAGGSSAAPHGESPLTAAWLAGQGW